MAQFTVVFVVSTLGQTGPTRQILNIIRYLDRREISVSLVTLSPEPEATLRSHFTELNVPFFCLGLERISGIFMAGIALRRRLEILQPDIVHTQGFRADYLSAGLTRYPHRVSTQRNIPEHDYPPLYGPLLGTLFASIHRRALQRIPVVVACSSSIALHYDGKEKPPVVITNGVDLGRRLQMPTQRARRAARAMLGYSTNGRIFVYAGPLIKRKNPILLIQSFLKWGDHPNHHLWILGDGPLLTTCRLLARGRSNILLPGHKVDLDPYFCAADIFLSASSAEGLPNAILEALAFGLPLLLSDIPPHREIIERDSRIGRLFSPGDPAAVIAGLDSMRPDNEMRLAARKLAESTFSAETMSRKYKSLYEEILQRSGAR